MIAKRKSSCRSYLTHMEYGYLNLPPVNIFWNDSNHLKTQHFRLNKPTNTSKTFPVSLHHHMICPPWLCPVNHHLYHHRKADTTVDNIGLCVCLHVAWRSTEVRKYCLAKKIYILRL